jgi:hypothetical protein
MCRAFLLCGVASTGGCAPWTTSSVELAQTVPIQQPDAVRVTLETGDRMVLTEPAILGDTLIGNQDGTKIRVLVEDVRRVELRRLSLWKSVGVVLAIPATLVAVLSILILNGGGVPAG